jgi:hypothetical protein
VKADAARAEEETVGRQYLIWVRSVLRMGARPDLDLITT